MLIIIKKAIQSEHISTVNRCPQVLILQVFCLSFQLFSSALKASRDLSLSSAPNFYLPLFNSANYSKRKCPIGSDLVGNFQMGLLYESLGCSCLGCCLRFFSWCTVKFLPGWIVLLVVYEHSHLSRVISSCFELIEFSNTSRCFLAKFTFPQTNLLQTQIQKIWVQLKMNYSSKQANEGRIFLCYRLDNQQGQFINGASFEMALLRWL